MAGPNALLEVVAGKATGMSIVVDDELVVGRNAQGAGKLAEDDELSRSHARIAIDGNGFCAVEDLGSTNGTFVNGLRITAPQTLSKGDTVELGGTTLVVRELPAVGAQDTAPSRVITISTPPAGDAAPEPAAAPEAAAGDSADEPAGAAASSAPDDAAAASAPGATPALSLQLEVDFSTREARLRLDEAAEPVRFLCEDGAWRLLAPETATKQRDST